MSGIVSPTQAQAQVMHNEQLPPPGIVLLHSSLVTPVVPRVKQLASGRKVQPVLSDQRFYRLQNAFTTHQKLEVRQLTLLS